MIFLEGFNIKIKKANTKQEIIDLIYQFRYYNLLPFNRDYAIGEEENLKEKMKRIKEELINKAHIINSIDEFSKNIIFQLHEIEN